MKKINQWFTDHTPASDKLAHYYWGDILWSNIGYILAIFMSFFIPSYTLILFPLLTVVIPAASKEKRDGELNENGIKNGNRELADFFYTIAPAIPKMIVVACVVYTFRNFILTFN